MKLFRKSSPKCKESIRAFAIFTTALSLFLYFVCFVYRSDVFLGIGSDSGFFTFPLALLGSLFGAIFVILSFSLFAVQRIEEEKMQRGENVEPEKYDPYMTDVIKGDNEHERNERIEMICVVGLTFSAVLLGYLI